MLASVGSLVMLIVGASLARAFAIAGVAGLVRYRAKIDDPKDASVMPSCLAVGLASGVGLLYLAAAGAAFIVGVLWVLEWREPWPSKSFELKVTV
jgi:tellurite resistance protein TehA-like permease